MGKNAPDGAENGTTGTKMGKNASNLTETERLGALKKEIEKDT